MEPQPLKRGPKASRSSRADVWPEASCATLAQPLRSALLPALALPPRLAPLPSLLRLALPLLLVLAASLAWQPPVLAAPTPPPAAGGAAAPVNVPSRSQRTVAARRVQGTLLIDGRLDDPDWQRARRISHFVQRSPEEGAPPDQTTELLLLHDESALYVGVRLLDTEPRRIRGGLGRRDSLPDSDMVTIYLDPVLSRERGYYFQINASGIVGDGLVYNEVTFDSSWDGIWDGAARVDASGWTAELRIPLTSIAIQERETQSWGIYVERYVQRSKQKSCWPPMPKSSNTFVSRFGTLEGLEGLRRRSHLRLWPFVSAELQLGRSAGSLRPDQAVRPSGGVDVSYALSGELTASATLNPDFGQVEEDPAVINLGPYELFVGERRPFFTEGADVFRTPIALLHTRRVGGPPPVPRPSDGGTIVESPSETRIIGAIKLVGIDSRLSYGLLSSLVLPADAVEALPDGTRATRRASATSLYTAARGALRLGPLATMGVMATALNRFEPSDQPDNAGLAVPADDAFAGGLDWDVRAAESGWLLRGQFAGSVSGGERAGYGLWAQAGQTGAPEWRYWVEAESFSRSFEINDVGYQWRNDMVRLRSYLVRRLASPWRRLREASATLWGQYGFNHSTPALAFERRLELALWCMLSNLWEVWGGGGYRFFTLDDRESRGGPPFPRPAELYSWLGGRSDSTRRIYLEGAAGLASEGDSRDLTLWATAHALPWERLSLSFHAKWMRQRGRTRWAATEIGASAVHYLFGELALDQIELRLNALVGLHRSLTVQLFGQLLHGQGSYKRYRELFKLDDGSTALGSTLRDPSADFSRLNVLLNAIVRWDLRHGAAAYLVYKLDGRVSASGSEVHENLSQALSSLTGKRQTHLLLLKASYAWDL